MKVRNIKIIETDTNRKGDLFSRLMGDLFYSLGYDNLRYDVHKSGREMDITAYHRIENKIAFAECKAHENSIGGDDINKFVGALGVEKSKIWKEKPLGVEVIGYFISISGFKQTAIEQELDAGNNRVILLDPEKIVKELIAGKILVRVEEAISQISFNKNGVRLTDYVDLFAHERGWIWVIYYTDGQLVTHYTFIHAEGKPLVRDIADEIIAKYGLFQNMNYIPSNNTREDNSSVKEKYYGYLKNECGDIQFDGLPIDKDSGSTKVNLEDIFVPLYLQEISNLSESSQSIISHLNRSRLEIGTVLSENKKIAILAKPGGGKSTLIKRLAIAYAFPDRRNLIGDHLPELDLVPIFIRCRELGDLVRHSITDIIGSIPNRAEIGHLKSEFNILVSESLQKGNALILIDGLDEISDERNRIIFVNQLRTFLSTYPNLFVIITSREAGFRAVSGALSNNCSHYNLASLSNLEIESLCVKWHKAIIDDSNNTMLEAKFLAQLIIKDKRISVLSRNPLLLTTLLFVKRYIGYLPTKRNVLYQEMIKLLLVTWNVEGYEQLDIEESEAQLAYVAFWMMQNGQQTITSIDLRSCLLSARQQLPEVLEYTKISVTEFIKRVESRSSLLIMSGHKNTEDGLIPVYEFLHLNFQEYLAAKAIAENYLPNTENNKSAIEVIEPYVMLQNWREVVPLLAVLLKRESKSLVEYLINRAKATKDESFDFDGSYAVNNPVGDVSTERTRKIRYKKENIPKILGSCLANEIQISSDTLENAIEWYIKTVNDTQESETIETIINSKFGNFFVSKVTSCFFNEFPGKYSISIASISAKTQLTLIKDIDEQSTLNKILNFLYTSDNQQKCLAILALIEFSYELVRDSNKIELSIDKEILFNEFESILENDDHYLSFCACWALSWIWSNSFFDIESEKKEKLIILLIDKWLHSEINDVSDLASWALSENMHPSYNINFLKNDDVNIADFLIDKIKNSNHIPDKYVALFVGINLSINLDTATTQILLDDYNHEIDGGIRVDILYANHLGLTINENDMDYGTADIYDPS